MSRGELTGVCVFFPLDLLIYLYICCPLPAAYLFDLIMVLSSLCWWQLFSQSHQSFGFCTLNLYSCQLLSVIRTAWENLVFVKALSSWIPRSGSAPSNNTRAIEINMFSSYLMMHLTLFYILCTTTKSEWVKSNRTRVWVCSWNMQCPHMRRWSCVVPRGRVVFILTWTEHHKASIPVMS